MAIIATLASIAVPIYMGLMERARIAKAMADIRILESEIAMFELDRTRLPVNLGEINRAVLKDPWDNGKSASPLIAQASGDDVIRANHGGYIGLAPDTEPTP